MAKLTHTHIITHHIHTPLRAHVALKNMSQPFSEARTNREHAEC